MQKKSASVQDKLVFSFDVGTGSLGCAIRLGEKIIHTRVYLFDPEFASTKRAAEKRRLSRTRLAHRAREYLLNQICTTAGIPVLKKIEATPTGDYRVTQTDPRLKREFAAAKDPTIYTSCLLRILLLEGKENELEPWQIYKALHSAIQRRGYGRVPWGQSGVRTVKEEVEKIENEEIENSERSQRFDDAVKKISLNQKYHLIPYFMAHQMGLWEPKKGILGNRVDHKARRASLLEGIQHQGVTASRKTVEMELALLLTAAKRRFPKLDIEQALYGIHKVPFEHLSELNPEERLIYTRTWQGLLGQKVPRFDNRILACCALIPRMHVARSDYEKNPLHSEIHLLLALHRLRPMDMNIRKTRPLTPEELKTIFESHLGGGEDGKPPTFKFTPRQLQKVLSKFNLRPVAGAEEIPPPKTGGRSRFSRPGAYLLKKLILDGKPPGEFLKAALAMPCAPKSHVTIQDNMDTTRGLVSSDLKWLELILNQPWEGIHVPDVQASEHSSLSRILKDLRNPVVRHRVEFFAKTLRDLCSWSQKNLNRPTPDSVAIELVREKLSETKKSEREKFNRSRKKERDEALEELQGEKKLIRKFMIAKAQDWKNLFPVSGENLQNNQYIKQADLHHYTIEHILPRSKGGPDAFWNLVLCPMSLNQEKGDRTPHEWLSGDPDRWNLFVKRVEEAKHLHSKTKQLLLSPLEQAQELADKYTHLAETAWIARLARRLIFSTLNWPENQAGEQRVIFVNGGLTAKLRRKYDLNRLLNTSGEDKKNRDTPLHHALDACVISFIDHCINPELTEKNLSSIKEGIFSSKLYNAGPRPALLEENFYGKRLVKIEDHEKEREFQAIVWRVPLPDLAIKPVKMKPVFNLDQLATNIKRLYPTPFMQKSYLVRDLLAETLEQLRSSSEPEQNWRKFCEAQLTANGGLRRVTLYEKIGDGLSELKEVTPNERGSKPHRQRPQILKPKGSHVGQFVVLTKDKKGKTKVIVRPLYVHETEPEVRQAIAKKGGEIRFFLKSGDYLELPEGTSDQKIQPGTYRLNSLKATGEVVLTSLLGEPVSSKRLNELLPLGLKPIQE